MNAAEGFIRDRLVRDASEMAEVVELRTVANAFIGVAWGLLVEAYGRDAAATALLRAVAGLPPGP